MMVSVQYWHPTHPSVMRRTDVTWAASVSHYLEPFLVIILVTHQGTSTNGQSSVSRCTFVELLKAVVDNNRKNVKKLEHCNGLQSSAFVSHSEIEPDYQIWTLSHRALFALYCVSGYDGSVVRSSPCVSVVSWLQISDWAGNWKLACTSGLVCGRPGWDNLGPLSHNSRGLALK